MLRDCLLLLLIPLVVPYPHLVNVHVLGFTFLRVDRFNPLHKLNVGLVIVSEGIVYVACDAMSIPGITGTVITISLLIILVDVIERFVR